MIQRWVTILTTTNSYRDLTALEIKTRKVPLLKYLLFVALSSDTDNLDYIWFFFYVRTPFFDAHYICKIAPKY